MSNWWEDIAGAAVGVGVGVATANPMLGISAGSAASGLIGHFDNQQPDPSKYLDPNSAFYEQARNSYFSQLQRTLNQNSAGTSSLIGANMAKGGDYGGSSYIGNKQRQEIETKNRESASSSASDFISNMYRNYVGMGTGMQEKNYDSIESFNNQLLGLGGGMGAKLLDKSNSSTGQQSGYSNDGSEFGKYMLNRWSNPQSTSPMVDAMGNSVWR